jgi:hypothetical protein
MDLQNTQYIIYYMNVTDWYKAAGRWPVNRWGSTRNRLRDRAGEVWDIRDDDDEDLQKCAASHRNNEAPESCLRLLILFVNAEEQSLAGHVSYVTSASDGGHQQLIFGLTKTFGNQLSRIPNKRPVKGSIVLKIAVM